MPGNAAEIAIAILVDQSGSMVGQRIIAALKAALLVYTFATAMGVPVMVMGHNSAYHGTNIYMYADFDSVGCNDKYRLVNMLDCDNSNRDGMAINIAAELLSRRPEEKKMLIVISDGQPADAGYGGDLAKADIQEIVRTYKHRGVQTFATAIGSDKEQM